MKKQPKVPPTLSDRAQNAVPVAAKQTIVHPTGLAVKRNPDGCVLHFQLTPWESLLVSLPDAGREMLVRELTGGIDVVSPEIVLP